MRRIVGFVFILALNTGLAWAQGSPPFTTDDAGTVAPGKWDLVVGAATERARNGDRTSTAPSVGLAYGLTENIEIQYAVGLLLVRVDGEATRSGLSNSVAGVKWRFLEDRTAGWAASVNPQVEFDNPTSSRRRGLVDNNTVFILPLQFQKSFGALDTALNVGRTFHSREANEKDDWMAGVAAGTKVGDRWHLGAEVYGGSARKFDRGRLIFNVGALYEPADGWVLAVSVGRGIAGADRPDFVGFAGVQLTR